MPDLRRPAESSSWLGIGIGLVVSAAIGLTAASKMGSIRQTRREQDTCDVDTKRYERTDVVATKKMTTRGDTNPNAVLKWINDNCIKMEPTETKEARKVIDTFIRQVVIDKMKETDSLFRAMYSNIYFTGSFYDGLRVKTPDEFDLNLILDLKLPKDTFRLVRNGKTSAGYVQLQVDDPRKQQDPGSPLYGLIDAYMKLLEHQDGEKFLFMPTKFRRWLISTLDRALVNLRNLRGAELAKYGIQKITKKESGPAITLIIEMKRGVVIDVDLVPVFAFFPQKQLQFYPEVWKNINHPKWLQKHGRERQTRISDALLGKRFFIVPKPTEVESQWRLDFHDAEIELIKDFGIAKPVIKSLKLFRDCNPELKSSNRQNRLASYYLKTIIMDMIKNNPEDEWRQGNEADYFLRALKHLVKKLDEKKIEYFFDANSNLLSKLNPVVIIEMKNFLKKVIPQLENSMNTVECKTVWLKYFKNGNCNFIH